MTVVVFCHDHAAGASFDPSPEESRRRDIELVSAPPAGEFAAVGWRLAGLGAAALAAAEPSRVGRLVLCCVPAPFDTPLSFDPSTIQSKTLLLYGQLDEDAPPAHARWWKSHLSSARVEIVPREGSDTISLMWGRVLSHAAPRTLRPKEA